MNCGQVSIDTEESMFKIIAIVVAVLVAAVLGLR